MKKHRRIFLISFLFLSLLVTSCNKIHYDQAEKQPLIVPSLKESSLKISHFNTGPESLIAFLWPSKEFFKRGQQLNLLDSYQNYPSYIDQTAASIFLASDEFDQWTLRYFQATKEVAIKLNEIREKKDPILAQIKNLNQKRTELKKKKKNLEKEMGKSKEKDKDFYKKKIEEVSQLIKDVFKTKKALQEELAPLKKQEELVKKRLEKISAHQLKQVNLVQQLLDPQASSFVYDDDGNQLIDSNGFPKRIINNKAQVNWLKTYKETASQDNYFDLSHHEKIIIRLGHWDNGQFYETEYRQRDDHKWELHPNSSIYGVSFSSNNVLKFKFREKDLSGNETDRIFEFELQFSPFGEHARLIGDILISVGSQIVREGQFKAMFLHK